MASVHQDLPENAMLVELQDAADLLILLKAYLNDVPISYDQRSADRGCTGAQILRARVF